MGTVKDYSQRLGMEESLLHCRVRQLSISDIRGRHGWGVIATMVITGVRFLPLISSGP
jgi:hypothetical protein